MLGLNGLSLSLGSTGGGAAAVVNPSFTGTLAAGNTLTRVAGSGYTFAARKWEGIVYPAGTVSTLGTGTTYAIPDPATVDAIRYVEQDSGGTWHNSAWGDIAIPADAPLYDSSDIGGLSIAAGDFDGDFLSAKEGGLTSHATISPAVSGTDFLGYDYDNATPLTSRVLKVTSGQIVNYTGTNGNIDGFVRMKHLSTDRYSVVFDIPADATNTRPYYVIGGYEISVYSAKMLCVRFRRDNGEINVTDNSSLLLTNVTSVALNGSYTLTANVDLTANTVQVLLDGTEVLSGSIASASFDNTGGQAQNVGLVPCRIDGSMDAGAPLATRVAVYPANSLTVGVALANNTDVPPQTVATISGVDTNVSTTAVHYRLRVDGSVVQNWIDAGFSAGAYSVDVTAPIGTWSGKEFIAEVRAIRSSVPAAWASHTTDSFPATAAYDANRTLDGNEQFPTYYTGVIPYNDLAMQTEWSVGPWQIKYEQQGAETTDCIGGADFGMTRTQQWPGATGSFPSFSGLRFRADHCVWTAAPTYADASMHEIDTIFGGSTSYGRYCGSTGTGLSISGTGSASYVVLPDNSGAGDGRVWRYTYHPTNHGGSGLPAYYSLTVLSGTVEVWLGDPTSGGTKIREHTSANNGTLYACIASSVWGDTMYLRAKPSSGAAHLHEYKAVIKGEEITDIKLTLPSRGPGLTANFIAPANTTWINANHTPLSGYTSGTGTGTITLAASTDMDYIEAIKFTGYNGSMSLPSGGLSVSIPLQTSGWGQASGTVWNAAFINDGVVVGQEGWRMLDWQPQNKFQARICSDLFPTTGTQGYQSEIDPVYAAQRANVQGLKKIRMSTPAHWHIDRVMSFLEVCLVTGSTTLNSTCKFFISGPNETWNNAYPGAAWADNHGAIRSQTYSGWIHDYIDAIEANSNLAPLLGVQLFIGVEWGADPFFTNDTTFNYLMDTTRGGVSLLVRLAEIGGCAFSTGGYALVPSYNDVTGVIGTGKTKAQYITEMDNQMAGTISDAQDLCRTHAERLANKSVAHDYNQNVIGFYTYEQFYHHQGSGATGNWGTPETNFDNAYYDYMESEACGVKMLAHTQFQLDNGWSAGMFQMGAGRLSLTDWTDAGHTIATGPGGNGLWPITNHTGYDAGTNPGSIHMQKLVARAAAL